MLTPKYFAMRCFAEGRSPLLRLDIGGLAPALATVVGLACAVGFAIGKLGAILDRDRFVSELKGQTR